MDTPKEGDEIDVTQDVIDAAASDPNALQSPGFLPGREDPERCPIARAICARYGIEPLSDPDWALSRVRVTYGSVSIDDEQFMLPTEASSFSHGNTSAPFKFKLGPRVPINANAL